MLAGTASSVAPIAASTPPMTRASVSRGLACPHCDAPHDLGATLCGYCGVTLGEPPRRSGMTQRALALDAESARLALEAMPSAPAAAPVAQVVVRQPRSLTWLERVFVVMTFGIGWLWLRHRVA